MKSRFFSLIILCCSYLSLCSGCAVNKVGIQSRSVLGTVCSINLYDQGYGKIYDEVFTRLQEIELAFSVNVESSDISRINDMAGKAPVSVRNDVFCVIEKALYYADLSQGAFDPTIGPLVKLWNIGGDNPRVPAQNEIDALLPFVDYRKVVLDRDNCSVYLAEKGMALDLGGIAKGYAADEVAAILDKYKIKQAIIDLGGNIYVYGEKKDKSDWKVGIKNPYYTVGDPALLLTLGANTTVVTSGVYERYFIQDDVSYHHILDSETGKPAVGDILSSTIISGSSMQADALSTIAFILGPKKFKSIADKENVQWVFIDKDRRVVASSGLVDSLRSYDSSYSDIEYGYQ